MYINCFQKQNVKNFDCEHMFAHLFSFFLFSFPPKPVRFKIHIIYIKKGGMGISQQVSCNAVNNKQSHNGTSKPEVAALPGGFTKAATFRSLNCTCQIRHTSSDIQKEFNFSSCYKWVG